MLDSPLVLDYWKFVALEGNIVASLALLWAEIDLAEGKTTSAATWLVTARNKFIEAEDERGVAHLTRLLGHAPARAE